MDEEELSQLLDAIDRLDVRLEADKETDDGFMLHEQLRDMHGYRVEGCSHTRPTPTEI